MKINVYIKKIRSFSKAVEPKVFFIENKPKTVEEFISECVKACIKLYKEEKADLPLTEEEIEIMKETGKVVFAVNYGNKEVDEERAIDLALDAFIDGVIKIFKDDKELDLPEDPIEVNEGDNFTFVRLTMLSGRMW